MSRQARAVLDRLPPHATMGVGSLPGGDPDAAVRHVMESYDIPFCPQLPALDGNMIDEWLGVPPGRCGWSPERDRKQARAWDAFLAAVGATPPGHSVVKLQVTGPVTLCWALEERGSEPAVMFARDVAEWLASSVRPQIDALSDRGMDCLLVVDEPALDLLPVRRGLVEAWEPLRRVGSAWGLHLCCAPPWKLVEEASPDFLNIDLVHHPLDDKATVSLGNLLRTGTTVAWGVTPTSAVGGPAIATRTLEGAIAQVVGRGLDQDDVARRSVLTASCGTGANSLREESSVAATLRCVAAIASQRAGESLMAHDESKGREWSGVAGVDHKP
jgi:hypothetical protein